MVIGICILSFFKCVLEFVYFGLWAYKYLGCFSSAIQHYLLTSIHFNASFFRKAVFSSFLNSMRVEMFAKCFKMSPEVLERNQIKKPKQNVIPKGALSKM